MSSVLPYWTRSKELKQRSMLDSIMLRRVLLKSFEMSKSSESYEYVASRNVKMGASRPSSGQFQFPTNLTDIIPASINWPKIPIRMHDVQGQDCVWPRVDLLLIEPGPIR